jgi:hypothetical protein
VLLLAMCLAPRLVAAWNWDVLWGDTLHFHYASVCLEQGDYDQGFAEFGLNIYPLIMIPLRHLEVDWQIAGKYFGVLVASLTVLPLWGWLRRMFDDRLAVIACLVYAWHGKLIAISPLIIRDSVFWFLLVLTLYSLWRAAGELRFRFFLAAGVALTLAVHTRTEGWLLLVPLLGWTACRWPSAAGRRLRLVAGTLLCLLVIPTAMTAVNVTWLRANPRWELLRTTHLQMAAEWWNAVSGMHVPVPTAETVTPAKNVAQPACPSPVTAKSPTDKPVANIPPSFPSIFVPVPVAPEQSTPGWILTFKLVERLAKGCTWVGCVLLLIGLAWGWRVLLRPEHLTLFCMNVLLLVVSRIRYWNAGLDLRYFMPVVIVGTAWMAIGLECALAQAVHLLERNGQRSARTLRILSGSLITFAVVCTLLDAPMSAAAFMRRHATMGRWVSQQAGPAPAIAGNLDHMSLETFYCHGRVVGTFGPRDCLIVPLPLAVSERQADVVVLWNEENIGREHLATIGGRLGYYGYRRIDANDLPAAENELLVFVRD